MEAQRRGAVDVEAHAVAILPTAWTAGACLRMASAAISGKPTAIAGTWGEDPIPPVATVKAARPRRAVEGNAFPARLGERRGGRCRCHGPRHQGKGLLPASEVGAAPPPRLHQPNATKKHPVIRGVAAEQRDHRQRVRRPANSSAACLQEVQSARRSRGRRAPRARRRSPGRRRPPGRRAARSPPGPRPTGPHSDHRRSSCPPFLSSSRASKPSRSVRSSPRSAV